ncbi:MutS-related protein [Faecalicatena fissicatena]|uniref:DNA mismatch repair proteins mutS family domain-containing protein n=1 Tax=Faecalicatena fissicatena TaxID=290055 RepID=A0ABS2EAV8_9FIRM|nr:hypothetical protein [Faecalicatena fissicatena]MBM6738750.1 hypothetical protein [Faecalicatena fissicatena]
MTGMIIVAGLVVFTVLVSAWNHRTGRKWKRARLLSSFGQKPEEGERPSEQTRILWEKTKAENGLDDITWSDLDMDDVFARVNTCCSWMGEQVLYKRMRDMDTEPDRLAALEEDITWLDRNEKERQELQLRLFDLGKRENSCYVPELITEPEIFELEHPWVYQVLQILLIASLLGGLGAAIFFRNMEMLSPFLFLFLVNMCVYALKRSSYEINLEIISAVQALTSLAGNLAESDRICGGHFREKFQGTKEAAAKLNKVLRVLRKRQQSQYSTDLSELVRVYVKGAFLVDFVHYNRAMKEISAHREEVLRILLITGELDVAVCAASFRRSLPLFCVPEYSGHRELELRDLYNPLIDEPVYNDLSLKTGCIITGSNASGKSTFIKAAAISAVLAASVHTCAASRARLYPFDVYTSIAIRDNLLAGESYFIKEIRSMERIIRKVDEGRPVLAVIDEILRGTNTKERIAASTAVLQYLREKGCLVIAATHDLEIAENLVSGPAGYEGFYFCEEAYEQGLAFDYRIHPGICRQTNAVRLLEVFGFPEEITREARRSLEE